MSMSQIQHEALTNATQNASMANYGAIFEGFEEKGIQPDDIKPRENVFTYHAWRALGRQVCKGQHGVKIETWIPCTNKKKLDKDGNPETYRRRKITTVFHYSQTEEIHA